MRRALPASTLPVVILITTSLSTVPNRSAYAQAGPDADRRAQLIRQAEQADGANDHVRALALAEQAAQISMSTSLRLFITEQQLALGRVVEALANAEACTQEAEANAQLVNRDVILAECRQHAETLATRVGHLVVRPPEPPPAGLHVSIAGHELDPTRFNRPEPVAPGTVVLDATAEGRRPVHREIAIAAGATIEVPLAFGTNGGSTQSAASTEPSRPGASATPPTGEHHTMIPYVVMGVGVVALGTSLAFFLLRNDALSTLDANCTPDSNGLLHCYDTPENRARYSDANTFSAVSIATVVGGALLVAGGAAWWLLDHRHPNREHASIGVAPLASGGAMLGIGGTF